MLHDVGNGTISFLNNINEPLSDVEDTTTSATAHNVSSKKRLGPFERLGLESFVTHAVSKLGFKLPTPVQRKAIPIILSGRDVVAMARTGSGKTAAFALPAIQKLKRHQNVVGIRCIILEPTRELAFQVAKVVRQLSRYTDLRICVIVGGCGMEAQFEKLTNNPDIIVASPGRLMHHIVEAALPLSAVDYLVIDEADQMFELGLGEQVEQILKQLNPNRQCILMSATLPSVLVDFSRAGLRSPEFVRLDVDNSLSNTLDMWYLYTRNEDKLAALLFILRELLLVPYLPGRPNLPQGVLIFVASRHHVDFLGQLLIRAGIPTSVAYGSMDQQARVESLLRFTKGLSKVLVVTDVAARGLDIPIIGSVINFDFPVSPKHFIHRVGRTARAGRPGLAISLVTRDELAYAIEVLLFSGLKFEIPNNNQSLSIINSSSESVNKIKSPSLNNNDELTHLTTPPSTGNPLYIGGLPQIPDDIEFVRQSLQEDSELLPMYETMMRSYIQYNKTRRSASRQSIRRAKQLLDGDAVKVLNTIHPNVASLLCSKGDIYQNEPLRSEFLAQLHSVKPKRTSTLKKGGRETGVLPCSVVSKMETICYVRNLKNFSMSQISETEHGECSSPNSGEDDLTLHNMKPGTSNNLEDSVPPSRRILSAAARRAMKQSPEKQLSLECQNLKRKQTTIPLTTDVFDWRALAATKSDFFLSTEKTAEELQTEVREGHLSMGTKVEDGLRAMSEAQFDLVPDDERLQKKTQHVRKWNAQRKRYIMTPVDAVSGKVLKTKQIKKRNEAGIICRGEVQKTGIYEKWTRSAKRRIQRVGEPEQNVIMSSVAQHPTYGENLSYGDPVSNNDSQLPSLSALTTDKGLVEAIQKGVKLTHKQERKAKRLLATQRGTVHVAPSSAQNELRTARQVAKVKKDAIKSKARQNVHFREAERKKSKEKHMNKRRKQAAEKSASRRSFMLKRTTRR